MAHFIQRLTWIGAVSLLAVGAPTGGSAQAAQHPARPEALRPSRLTSGLGPHGGVLGMPAAGALAMPLRAAARTGGGQGFLFGVNLFSAASGWAIGLSCGPNCGQGAEDTLIQHWNGRAWSRVPSPSPSPIEGLFSVSAASPKDAWAVGVYATRANAFATLILHWNGTRWSKVASPDPGTGPGGVDVLTGVTSVSARNAWAVGSFCAKHCEPVLSDDVAGRTLALHWNGTRWSAR
jgi:hypothetical protein